LSNSLIDRALSQIDHDQPSHYALTGEPMAGQFRLKTRVRSADNDARNRARPNPGRLTQMRSSNDRTPSGSGRPFATLHKLADEREVSARKRSSAEGPPLQMRPSSAQSNPKG
jgi:hypothetical protein